MAKHDIRKRLLKLRKQTDEKTCREASLLIQQNFIVTEVFRQADTLALYSPVNNEVATEQLFSVARNATKRVCYPRVVGESLEFIAVESLADLVPGAFGVSEPTAGEVVKDIDVVVVPGAAFDRNGFRLGYGKGFYDRQLAGMQPRIVSVGLCYEFQLCDSLPVEAHDQPLDYVATEARFIPCYKGVAGSP